MNNIFAGLPPAAEDEAVENIAGAGAFRIERIVSRGQATPAGEWFDQAQDEWVLLLAGAAVLRIEGEPQAREMTGGDHLLIPAGCRHRVEWTDPECETVWLAVHFPAGGAP